MSLPRGLEVPVMRFTGTVLTVGVMTAAGLLPLVPARAQRTFDTRLEAIRLYRAGNYREALPLFDAVLDRHPKDIEALNKRASIRLRMSQPELALADLNWAIALSTSVNGFPIPLSYPTDFPALFNNRGLAHLALGRNEEARDDFRRAVDLYRLPINHQPPFNDQTAGIVSAHTGLGEAYLHLGQVELAFAQFAEAIRTDPTNPSGTLGRALAYEATGELTLAMTDLNEALRIDPSNAQAYLHRGALHARLGEVEEALRDLSQALRIRPDDAEARSRRATLLARLGRSDQALAELGTEPSSASARIGRGAIFVDQGQYRRAIKDLDAAIQLDPRRASAYQNRGAAYNSLGQYERALRDLDEALRLDPASVGSHNNRGLALWSLGRASEAIDALSQAIALDPNEWRPRLSRASAYAQLGQLDRAMQDYDATLRLMPRSVAALVGRGSIRALLGQHTQAIADLDAAMRLAPRDASVLALRAHSRRATDDWEGAIADETRALELEPGRVELYASRAWSRLALDQPGADDDARAYIEQTRWRGPQASYMAMVGALAAWQAGRTPEARALLSEAMANSRPGAWPVPAVRYLRRELTSQELLDAARESSRLAEAHLFVGLDLLTQGDRTGAIEHLSWVRQQGPKPSLAAEVARCILRRLETDSNTPAPR